MATLTIPQIAQLAVDVGISNGMPLYEAVSIALAESSGRTDAVNVSNADGSTDKGLWQINSVHDDKLPGRDRFDPEVNAQLMAQISAGGTNWYPWTTYNSGAYLDFLAQVTTALGGTPLVPTGGSGFGSGAGNGLTADSAGLFDDLSAGLGAASSGIAAIEKFFRLITSVEGWIRILKVYCGGVLILSGLVMLLASSPTTRKVTSAAVTLVPGGKAAKAGLKSTTTTVRKAVAK